ncbi:cytochrome P450 [Saccharata proteae CBS 121410]|uniref:Cytochrome P450 n=1 Tax=Saccharata proteae CBS 121410 TaxID=1314787 RepID=A0A9P4LW65_9PEZI|nr:cytochrome P450 [Saccharata proteae CBS 121410]
MALIDSILITFPYLEISPSLLLAIISVAVVCFILVLSPRKAKIKVPLVGSHLSNQEFISSAEAILHDNHSRYGDRIYRLKTEYGETLIISPKYLDELKYLPDDVLNFGAAVRDMFAGRYSLLSESLDPTTLHALKSDLTPALGRLMPAISDEIDTALKYALRSVTEAWTPIRVHPAVLDVITQVSACLFVGEPLCRDQRWIALTRDYITYQQPGIQAINNWKPWLRPFIYRFIPELQKLYKVRREAVEFLKPYIQARQNDDKRWDDMTQWMQDGAGPGWRTDYEAQATSQIELAGAALHTTSMALTHALFDLAAHKAEYLGPLRSELQSVLAQTNNTFTKATLSKLSLLDSFVKESQRINPLGYTTFRRRVMRDLALSDGTVLPTGTLLEINVHSRDRDLVQDPDVFDGFRYHRLRQQEGMENEHLFFGSSSEYLNWGAGRHACPGRVLAATEVKMVLANVLMEYDLELSDGIRPKNLVHGFMITPDPAKELMFRKRAV